MDFDMALQMAAEAWTTDATSHITMDPALCKAFAGILHRELYAANRCYVELEELEILQDDLLDSPQKSIGGADSLYKRSYDMLQRMRTMIENLERENAYLLSK